MRLQHGNFPYELGKAHDQQSRTMKGWEFRIYRVRPFVELLHVGHCCPTRRQAEHEAALIITLYQEQEWVKAA